MDVKSFLLLLIISSVFCDDASKPKEVKGQTRKTTTEAVKKKDSNDTLKTTTSPPVPSRRSMNAGVPIHLNSAPAPLEAQYCPSTGVLLQVLDVLMRSFLNDSKAKQLSTLQNVLAFLKTYMKTLPQNSNYGDLIKNYDQFQDLITEKLPFLNDDKLIDSDRKVTDVVTDLLFKYKVPEIVNDDCKRALGQVIEAAKKAYVQLANNPVCSQSSNSYGVLPNLLPNLNADNFGTPYNYPQPNPGGNVLNNGNHNSPVNSWSKIQELIQNKHKPQQWNAYPLNDPGVDYRVRPNVLNSANSLFNTYPVEQPKLQRLSDEILRYLLNNGYNPKQRNGPYDTQNYRPYTNNLGTVQPNLGRPYDNSAPLYYPLAPKLNGPIPKDRKDFNPLGNGYVNSNLKYSLNKPSIGIDYPPGRLPYEPSQNQLNNAQTAKSPGSINEQPNLSNIFVTANKQTENLILQNSNNPPLPGNVQSPFAGINPYQGQSSLLGPPVPGKVAYPNMGQYPYILNRPQYFPRYPYQSNGDVANLNGGSLTNYPHQLSVQPNSDSAQYNLPPVTDQFNNAGNPGVIELTYLVKRPNPLKYQPYYYVKYRLPYDKFLNTVQSLRSPDLGSNDKNLTEHLIVKSNVAELSPDLKDYPENHLAKLVLREGKLTSANFIDENQRSYELASENDKILRTSNASNSNTSSTDHKLVSNLISNKEKDPVGLQQNQNGVVFTEKQVNLRQNQFVNPQAVIQVNERQNPYVSAQEVSHVSDRQNTYVNPQQGSKTNERQNTNVNPQEIGQGSINSGGAVTKVSEIGLRRPLIYRSWGYRDQSNLDSQPNAKDNNLLQQQNYRYLDQNQGNSLRSQRYNEEPKGVPLNDNSQSSYSYQRSVIRNGMVHNSPDQSEMKGGLIPAVIVSRNGNDAGYYQPILQDLY